MSSTLRASRWSTRLVRRCLLIAAAIAIIVLAACSAALADEPASTADEASSPTPIADTTALARRAVVDGRLDDALRALAKVIASAPSDDERAAAGEVRAIVDRWVALGGVVVPRVAPAPIAAGNDGVEVGGGVSSSDAWESAFSVSRARLVAGDFEDAASGLSLLLGSARTHHQTLRAYALAALASELVGAGRVLGVARRAERGAQRPPPPPRTTRWYGWQTLIADGASIAVVPALGSQLGSSGSAVAYVAIGGYLFGAPIVHLAHGRPGMAAGSLGLRVAMPVVGAGIGAGVQGDCRGDFCGLGGALAGGVLGLIGATVLDAAAFSYERVDGVDEAHDASATRTARGARRAQAERAPAVSALTPSFGPRREGGFDVGVAGAF